MKIIGAVVLSVLFRVLRVVGQVWLNLPSGVYIVIFGALLYLLTLHYLNLVFILAYGFFAFVVYAVTRPVTRIMVFVLWIILLRAYWQAIPVTPTASMVAESHHVVLR